MRDELEQGDCLIAFNECLIQEEDAFDDLAELQGWT